MVCSGRLWGGTADTGRHVPAGGSRRGRRRQRANGLDRGLRRQRIVLRRERGRRASTRSRSSPPNSRPSSGSAKRRCCGSACATPAHKTLPSADRDDLGRRQGGPQLTAALRLPRPRARPRPAGPAGLGALGALPEGRTARSERAGAETASPKTFDFGPLKPGRTTEAVWKLSAVKTGNYTLFFEVGAGLGGTGRRRPRRGPKPAAPSPPKSLDVPPETK